MSAAQESAIQTTWSSCPATFLRKTMIKALIKARVRGPSLFDVYGPTCILTRAMHCREGPFLSGWVF